MTMAVAADEAERGFGSSSMLATPGRALFGFRFVNDGDVSAIVERVLAPQPADDHLPLVVTPNVDYIVRLREPGLSDLAEALPRARYVLPDGQPIVWTSRLVKPPLAARLPGSTMFPVLWRRVVQERRPAVIVASTEETAAKLRSEHAGVGVVVPPHFDEDDPSQLADVVESCRAAIDEVKPEFVFLGISFPKQQRIALALVDHLQRSGDHMPLFLLFGGSFEMYLGTVRRAPRWMQRAGLEWFFRFILEPRRLFRRYFVTDTRFAWLLAREFVNARFTSTSRS